MTTATETKERPILFSGPMVKAILEGRKTQTRRVVKFRQFQPSDTPGYDWTYRRRDSIWEDIRTPKLLEKCPYGKPGDRLWVRETYLAVEPLEGKPIPEDGRLITVEDEQLELWYRANCELTPGGRLIHELKWTPSIFMPRWASRITLEITGVRVERVQDITEQDAIAEGVLHNWIGDDCPPEYQNEWFRYGSDEEDFPCYSAKESFETLWDSINKERGYGWDVNPWVFAVEFRRVKP